MITEKELRANIERIRHEIGPMVKIIGVTKNRSPQAIDRMIEAGISMVGENRIQEAEQKFPHLSKKAEKHYIGHLQTNKVKRAIELFDMIQSVDSLRLAQKINDEAKQKEKIMPSLLQVNIANDPNKHGFAPEELEQAIKIIGIQLPYVQVKGLMAILPQEKGSENTRSHFRRMKELFESLKHARFPGIDMEELSMGMTEDYPIAVQEGATMIRIGRGLFDPV